MRFYAITFDKVVIRFYLMMGVVLLGMFSGYYLIAGLALPLFLSAVLGISFKPEVPVLADSKVLPLAKAKQGKLEKAA
ncbi:hypothetical protein CLV84_0564 [Neolewinella xylanilytica]|uniref:Uncharacterized protein n=1 Tax=Neolewinella xylanilytica TaxID=1514080 RepID=A0A2S6I803_9BACT|nr:hypothetical protein [Neolewinella xylanilytica]PPK87618.1 hypothetical protein CLV84_0564 [Neolewinella xylanilytica]